MLPLIQRQPCAMPRPTGLDAHSPVRPYPAEDPRRPRDCAPSFPRAFPIRTSQSYRRAALCSSSPYPSRNEHRLRRKSTIEGEVDPKHDNCWITPISGTASFGRMPVPMTDNPDVHGSFLAGHQQARYVWPFKSPLTTPMGREESNAVFSVSDGDDQNHSKSHSGVPNHLRQNAPTSFTSPRSFPNIHEPIIRANDHNVRAFCPPPLPASETLPFGQAGWHPAHWDSQTVGQLRRYPTNQAMTPHVPLNAANRTDLSLITKSKHPVAQQYTEQSYISNIGSPAAFDGNSLSLGADLSMSLHSRAHNTQLGFREKALTQAHRAYMNLLRHLHESKKLQSGGASSRSPGSSKPFIYPKPPNPLSTITSEGGGPWGPQHKPHWNIAKQPCYSYGDQMGSSTLHKNYAASSHQHHQGHGIPRTLHDPFPKHLASNPESSTYMRSSDSEHGGYSHSPSATHPAATVMVSLNILNTLCEQSGWKWIDGMLLGGCLHYGLENYEIALQWFSRVMTCDDSHVVALTNVAATMYCLGRQSEAEQYWLRAVRLQPSYLEASEHLVGLLYKKRSKDAIEIISYVQQALSLTDSAKSSMAALASAPATAHTKSSLERNTRLSWVGFGSSGYALPGSDNGRILALVHAKGTMLYSLKDINRASEAFEEAVLISIGRRAQGIHSLVRHVQTVLNPMEYCKSLPQQPLQPLLLPPERARQTARLVFPGTGELPGLTYVTGGGARKAANQTTSNSLLSLAKIFQDTMSGASGGSGSFRRPSGVGDILALYYLSLSLQESPSTANNVGILLAGVQQAAPMEPGSIEPAPPSGMPGVPPGSGLALALAYYQYGLRLDPKHVHLHTNLGSLLKDLGQLDLAIQMYEQAVLCDGNFDIALTNLANAVKDRGRINDAIAYYRRAVKSNPNFAEAVCGLLTALNSVCDWKGRGGVFVDSGRVDRWHVDDDGSLVDSRASRKSRGLTGRVVNVVRQQLREASQWGSDILQEDIIHDLAPQLADLCELSTETLITWLRTWRGKPWEGSRLLRLIERATHVILRRWYRQNRHQVTHQTSYMRLRLPANLTIPSAPTVLPFHTFTCPLGPQDIRAISQRNALRISCSTLRAPWVPLELFTPPPPPQPHLNIGYLSSDFNNHPLAHLMQSVFGFHDTKRVRAICYATTASDNSVYRRKIEEEAPIFRDVSTWPPDHLVRQIVRDEIHILVNLNGYTRGARNEIFAARPAPIQMSFMGFAGTLGAEWCDYILADMTAVPRETLRPWRSNLGIKDVFYDDTEGDLGNWVYSENVIFCRDTFFCCDHAQSSDESERTITWEEELIRRWQMRKDLFPWLPDDAVILGNFNQLYKIDPTTFRLWLRILSQTPRARLWLLRFPELGEKNLRETARLWAGHEVASRLIFTDVAPKSQHISRARVCDLFLDTPECNAHTTAADVLWSSTPLLTTPRYSYKMCSRMAASILKGALPSSEDGKMAASELIADDDTEYERMAAELAGALVYDIDENGYGTGRGRLFEIRKLLWESKWTCALFDTRRWVSNVESAYEEAWRKWVAGEAGDIHL